MSMSDCIACWLTPCECGHDYWLMPLERAKEIAQAASEAVRAREAGEAPPPTVAAELEREARNREAMKRMTAEDWGRSFTISADELGKWPR